MASNMKIDPIPLLLAVFLVPLAHSHDLYEITLDAQQKRNRIVARLEMARSTSVAASTRAPSQGHWWEPSEFETWKTKIEAAAPQLIKIRFLDTRLAASHIEVGLNREDDVRIDYIFDLPESTENLGLQADILSRFSEEGFGVRVTFRDKSGRWHPPFMIMKDTPVTALPSR